MAKKKKAAPRAGAFGGRGAAAAGRRGRAPNRGRIPGLDPGRGKGKRKKAPAGGGGGRP